MAPDDRKTRPDANTTDDARDRSQVGQGRKNVSNEPLPDLSEKGGIEPLQDRPDDYNDRTRDRALDES